MKMLPKIVIDKSPFYAMSRGYGYLGGQFCTEARLITFAYTQNAPVKL